MNIRESVDEIFHGRTRLTDRFYEILFERTPEAQRLFEGVDMNVQSIMLTMALGAILLVGLGHDATQIDRRSLLGGVVAGAMFGLFFIALAQTDPASGLWPLVAARATTIPVAFAIAAYRGVAGPPRSSDLGVVVVAGTFDMAANIAGALALQRGPVGVTAVLVSLYPAVTAVTAIVVLHERPTGLQIAGIILAMAALVALVG
jgi:threonine/homoserine efflux transporter RhtA